MTADLKYVAVNAPPIISLRAHKGSSVGVPRSSNRECLAESGCTTGCTQQQ